MTSTQKKVAWVVAGISLVYFLLFFPANNTAAKTQAMFTATSVDEPVTYPYVVRMLSADATLKSIFSRWVLYGDYHYGWLFYAFSALVLLPVRLIYGGNFAVSHLQLNILLLRQFISVLPMILSIVLMVYLMTKFKSMLQTVALLVVMFSVRSLVRNDIHFWHPDALSTLACVVTLFFLERDHLRFGQNFYIAAAACGIAIGIKLAGVFFFLAISGYILAGLFTHALTIKKTILVAVLFLAVMAVALVVTNPFLYNDGARAELVKIQTQKTDTLASGYAQGDPSTYKLGPAYWDWTLKTWFGYPLFLAFIGLSLLAGCFWGPNKLLNRLILAWCVPYAIYLLYFVAVKPDHYWWPVMVPFFAAMLTLPPALKEALQSIHFKQPNRAKLIYQAVTVLVAVVLAGHFVTNVTRSVSGNIAIYQYALQQEKTLKR
jgi:hypothetical protein